MEIIFRFSSIFDLIFPQVTLPSAENTFMWLQTTALQYSSQAQLGYLKKKKRLGKAFKKRQSTLMFSEGLSHVSMASFLAHPGHVGQYSLKAKTGWLTSIKEAMILTNSSFLRWRVPQGPLLYPPSPKRQAVSCHAFKCPDSTVYFLVQKMNLESGGEGRHVPWSHIALGG